MFHNFRSASQYLLLTGFCVLASSVAALAGTVNVSSPANGSTVGSPAHFVASASSSAPVSAITIYVDNNIAFSTGGGSLDTYLNLAPGPHYVVVKAWDSAGSVFASPLTVNTGAVPISAGGGARTISDVDNLGGWETCASCAGANGTGPATPHYVGYGIASPSLDGRSAQFTNAGNVSYSDAIWWRQLGANPGATHFIYDLYVYVQDMAAAEALEFDVNQSTGGRKYIFGTQCGVNHDHQWDVWGNGRWNPTGVGCSLNASSWNHISAEFYRANGTVYYVAVTVNGNKSYLNRAFGSIGSGASEVNVAFQMDQTIVHRPFAAWLDKVSLTAW